ncbi:hypothetical protein N7478_006484 [Penicillium angulare]|uniref:uncharacterized protein n=1 Tax=Penicillium angulare TaxID=116970 RepID=UPI00253FA6DF|nr:uncharacterized protein N7478_006484 [Penicillium angulare]KAJ5281112.1 hypothetical protein N7478_006484 [Penicillium angulare]
MKFMNVLFLAAMGASAAYASDTDAKTVTVTVTNNVCPTSIKATTLRTSTSSSPTSTASDSSESCIARHGDCTPNTCCSGLQCVGYTNWSIGKCVPGPE